MDYVYAFEKINLYAKWKLILYNAILTEVLNQKNQR